MLYLPRRSQSQRQVMFPRDRHLGTASRQSTPGLAMAELDVEGLGQLQHGSWHHDRDTIGPFK